MLALDGTSDLSSYDGGFPCSVSIELLDQMEPWPNNRETLSLFQIWRETGKLIGAQIEEQARGGLSDGNLLSTHYPTIDGLGPVGANAHCSERTADGSKVQEYVTISSFVPRALLNTLSILKIIDLSILKIIEESSATDIGQ
jgi:glutamate carboxypeptidase